jgi:TatD DNase family protein
LSTPIATLIFRRLRVMKNKALRKPPKQAFRRSLYLRSKRLIFRVFLTSLSTIALYAALGLHPIVIERHLDEHIEKLDEVCKPQETNLSPSVRSGSISREDPQFERQQTILDAQLRLAKRHDLPVILHSRRTHDKLAMHLKRIDLPRTGVVHGFSGSLQQAQRFIELGYKIGVGGTITYPRASKTRT